MTAESVRSTRDAPGDASGALPMPLIHVCCYCRCIKTPAGVWRDSRGAPPFPAGRISHGICDDCLRHHLPECEEVRPVIG